MTRWLCVHGAQVAALSLALASVALPASAADQALRDPTQPPQLVAPPVQGAEPSPTVPGEPQLQSVLISSRGDGRRVAVIDGETVREGDKFRDAKVVKIAPTEVVLMEGKNKQVLVMKTPSTARAPAPKAEAAKPAAAKTEPAKVESAITDILSGLKVR